MNDLASEVLAFWFAETQPRQWFGKDPAFDALLRVRFLGLSGRAIGGELDARSVEPRGAQALALSQRALARGSLETEAELAVQEAAQPLFERCRDPRTADFARRQRDVIARFGRFPHRNAALGRVSSAEEEAFLQLPGSRF